MGILSKLLLNERVITGCLRFHVGGETLWTPHRIHTFYISHRRFVAEPRQSARETTCASYALADALSDKTRSCRTFFFSNGPHPEVMRKGAEELDLVVGKGHLPDFSDRVNLPYIDAIVKEIQVESTLPSASRTSHTG